MSDTVAKTSVAGDEIEVNCTHENVNTKFMLSVVTISIECLPECNFQFTKQLRKDIEQVYFYNILFLDGFQLANIFSSNAYRLIPLTNNSTMIGKKCTWISTIITRYLFPNVLCRKSFSKFCELTSNIQIFPDTVRFTNFTAKRQ